MRRVYRFGRIVAIGLLAGFALSSVASAQLREQPELLKRLWPFGRLHQRPVAQLARPAESVVIAKREQPLIAPLVTRKIDINTCTLSQLQDLPGVGPSMGAHLMAGRPYRGFEDLERDGVPLNVVAGLRGVIVFGQ